MQRICVKNLFFLLLVATNMACGTQTLPTTDENQQGGTTGGEQTCTQLQDCRGGEICQGGLCIPDPELEEETPIILEDGGIGFGTLSALPAQDIEFGAQQLGIPVTRQITLINTGTAPLTLLFITLDDTSGEFSLDQEGQLDTLLAPQETFHLEASHTPTDGEPDMAEIKVVHNGEGGLYRIGLAAEFKGDAILTVGIDGFDTSNSISTHDFGERAVEDAPYSQSLWLTNTGSRDSILTVEDITITPTGAGFDFADDIELPWVLGARSTMSCTEETADDICDNAGNGCIENVCTDENGHPLQSFALPLTFTPQESASQAVVTLFHTADESGQGDTVGQYEILLSGGPTLPNATVSASQLTFPSTLVGGGPSETALTISNTGTGTLTYALTPPNVTAFTFPTNQESNGSIAPGADATIAIHFTPSAAETYTGTFEITFNTADAAPMVISLVGDGWTCPDGSYINDAADTCLSPVAEVSTQQLSFDATLVGGDASEEVLVINNTGTWPLTYSLSSPTPAIFAWPANQSSSGEIPPGASANITVIFTPLAAQVYTGEFGITFNTDASSPTIISLVGAGWSCPPHAHVTEGTTCTCDDGYNTCGSDCLLPSPDSCGDDCITCDIRSGSDRDCISESCVYECQDYRFDLNNDLSATQGADSDGCEYTCANLSPQTETCNGIDDDCDGFTDEDLDDDEYEPNDDCAIANNQGVVTQERIFEVMIYPQGDDDWFTIRGEESDQNICNLCDVFADTPATQSYQATFALLDVPANLELDLTVKTDQCSGNSGESIVSANATTDEINNGLADRMYTKLQHTWTTDLIPTEECAAMVLIGELFGYTPADYEDVLEASGYHAGRLGCGFLDWRDYFINIRATNDVQTCEPFSLRVTYESL